MCITQRWGLAKFQVPVTMSVNPTLAQDSITEVSVSVSSMRQCRHAPLHDGCIVDIRCGFCIDKRSDLIWYDTRWRDIKSHDRHAPTRRNASRYDILQMTRWYYIMIMCGCTYFVKLVCGFEAFVGEHRNHVCWNWSRCCERVACKRIERIVREGREGTQAHVSWKNRVIHRYMKYGYTRVGAVDRLLQLSRTGQAHGPIHTSSPSP